MQRITAVTTCDHRENESQGEKRTDVKSEEEAGAEAGKRGREEDV